MQKFKARLSWETKLTSSSNLFRQQIAFDKLGGLFESALSELWFLDVFSDCKFYYSGLKNLCQEFWKSSF